mgnify:CR=1 FL=1
MSSGLAQKYLSVPSIRSICIGEDSRLQFMLQFSRIPFMLLRQGWWSDLSMVIKASHEPLVDSCLHH